MMTDKWTKKDQELYDKHLKEVQKKNPKVDIILDTSEEDADWLKGGKMLPIKETMRYTWKHLNRQQVGAFSEYFVKMEMTMHAFQVYSPEVDDRGIDCILRYENGPFLSIQVKSIRGKGYVFMRKENFELSLHNYLALALLHDGIAPRLFLIPSEAWKKPNELLVSRDYEGKRSKPEWGLNVSNKNMKLLETYSFSSMIAKLKKQKA